MKQRTAEILEASISEFIRAGKPVSSDLLFEKGSFNVRPATIRAELNYLTETGYLYQPHTSGGRIPTDKGYEFFVEIVSNDLAERELKISSVFERFVGKFINDAINDFVVNISDELQLLTVSYGVSRGVLHKSGLDDLFANLDFDSKDDFYSVVEDFEMLDARVDRILNHLSGNSPSVFIGKSPITKSPHLSVVADVYKKDDEKIVLLAIGPKRMNYEKTIKTFRSLHKK